MSSFSTLNFLQCTTLCCINNKTYQFIITDYNVCFACMACQKWKKRLIELLFQNNMSYIKTQCQNVNSYGYFFSVFNRSIEIIIIIEPVNNLQTGYKPRQRVATIMSWCPFDLIKIKFKLFLGIFDIFTTISVKPTLITFKRS